jgi:hypothetical protein
MNKDIHSNLMIILLFPLAGLVLLVICFLTYFGVFSLFRFIIKERMPVGFIRQMFAMALVLMYLLIYRFKFSDKVKAILMIGPLGTLIITVILTFYQNIPLFVSLVAAVVIVVIYLIYRFKKPWYFYYATVLALLAALAYGWPRPL